MQDLIDILEINIDKVRIFEITEEHLVKLKNTDFTTQNKFYFFLINKIHRFENERSTKELAYSHFLMSYFIFVVLMPLNFEELSFYHINKAIDLDKTNLDFKEWILIFATLELPLLDGASAVRYANELVENNIESNLANLILTIF